MVIPLEFRDDPNPFTSDNVELLSRHLDTQLRSYARLLGANPEDAMDLVQETWMRVLPSLSYRPLMFNTLTSGDGLDKRQMFFYELIPGFDVDRFTNYTRRILRNLYINSIRRNSPASFSALLRIDTSENEDLDEVQIVIPARDQDIPGIAFEEAEAVRNAIDELKGLGKRFRMAVELRAEGFSPDQIAERLGVQTATVRAYYSRGRKELRERIYKRDQGIVTNRFESFPLDSLSEPYRSVAELHNTGLSPIEIAKKLGRPNGTVRSQISRLKQYFQGQYSFHEMKKGENRTQGALVNVQIGERELYYLEKLPSHFRDAIGLHCVNKLSYIDIAEIQRCSVNTIKSHVLRGKNLLMSYYTGYEGDKRTLND